MTSFTSASTFSRTFLLLTLSALAGCSETGPAAELSDYVQRLERVLEQGAHPFGERDFPRLPAVRDIRLEPDRENIDILEFLRIGRCELQQLVAERNSNLGRLAEPSQRLVYELNFIRFGNACLEAITADYPELATDLAAILDRKRESLPVAIWQATLGGDEFRAFWKTSSASLPATFESDSALLLALAQLTDDIRGWMSGATSIDSSRLESQLDSIRRGNAGVLMRAWATIDNRLETANQVVADRLVRRPLCFDGMSNPKAAILDTVVREHFVRDVQGWAAALSTRTYEMFPRIRALEAQLVEVEPPAYRSWRADRDAFLERSTGALARHVAALEPLMRQCDLLPARPGAGDG